jgi:quercetin dioxygenase-like cupin family protein
MTEVRNALADEWEELYPQVDGWRANHRRLAPPGNKLGMMLYELQPGQTQCPYHFHHGNEELLLVLRGRPTLRTPDGEQELEPGDVVHFATGPGGAHHVVNRTAESALRRRRRQGLARDRRVPGQRQARRGGKDGDEALVDDPPRRQRGRLLRRRAAARVSALEEIAPGLHRWTARHGEWKEDVDCLAVETADGLVLVDPLDPPRSLGNPDHVLLTVFWHYRGVAALGAREVWADRRAARRLANRGVEVTRPIDTQTELPGGIRAFETARESELVYWLPKQKAVAVGDVLLGAGAKPRATDDALRLCPQRWLGKASHGDLRASLRPLLELPVQRVLVSHGEPVLRAGKRTLANVLA